jgi:histidinol dehydrogenase
VEAAVEAQLLRLSTQEVARKSWDAFGVVIVVEDLERDAPALANALAAEHVEIATDDPDAIFAEIRHAGSAFLGRHTPEAIGDYVAGPNHVLPTGRRARFASGLSVLDFMKRTSFLQLDEAALAAIGPAAVALASAEGLPAHGLSVSVRLEP